MRVCRILKGDVFSLQKSNIVELRWFWVGHHPASKVLHIHGQLIDNPRNDCGGIRLCVYDFYFLSIYRSRLGGVVELVVLQCCLQTYLSFYSWWGSLTSKGGKRDRLGVVD